MNFNNRFAPYQAQAQQLAAAATSSGATPASLPSIKQQRIAVAAMIDQLALATHNGLLSSLSPKGADALTTQIADVKKHMKIIPPPKM